MPVEVRYPAKTNHLWRILKFRAQKKCPRRTLFFKELFSFNLALIFPGIALEKHLPCF